MIVSDMEEKFLNTDIEQLKVKIDLLGEYDMTAVKETVMATDTSKDSSPASSSSSVDLELFMRSGWEQGELGASPESQSVFMYLLLKQASGSCSFTVTTVNSQSPPEELRDICKKLPSLRVGRVIYQGEDDAFAALETLCPQPPLSRENEKKAFAVQEKVFSKFTHFIHVQGDLQGLLGELHRIDSFLAEHGHSFMMGNEISHVDCILLPKLHHIRLVIYHLRRERIPVEFEHLLAYLQRAYESDVLQPSWPLDQEILLMWLEKVEHSGAMVNSEVNSAIRGMKRRGSYFTGKRTISLTDEF